MNNPTRKQETPNTRKSEGITGVGSIEQDADVVMMIYREEVYRPEANNHGRAEILLRKARQGETGTVRCTFSGEFQRFEEDTSTPADKTKAYNAAQDKKFARQESKVQY